MFALVIDDRTKKLTLEGVALSEDATKSRPEGITPSESVTKPKPEGITPSEGARNRDQWALHCVWVSRSRDERPSCFACAGRYTNEVQRKEYLLKMFLKVYRV